MPVAEHDVDARLVEDLVGGQHPDLAAPVDFFAEGWDTSVWRLGTDLLVRMPRRAMAVAGLEAEQRWLPVLGSKLPLPIPVPLRIGIAGCGFPWPWSIVPLLEGTPALERPRLDSSRAAATLGRFLRALHSEAPPDAPRSEIRGVALSARIATFEELVVELRGDLDEGAVRRTWTTALEADAPSGSPTWVHGDLHPGNVLVRDGDLVGVIDFNDLNGGDPATDLSAAWLFFEPEHLGVLLDAYGGADHALVTRARGWALLFSMLFVSVGREGRAGYGVVGRDGLRRALADGNAA